ncbi:DUF4349 domain-containing protein [Patescibacteria group bacterium]|nr:DUF4349 domain-containing protein [Patescibacteria group bacterium]
MAKRKYTWLWILLGAVLVVLVLGITVVVGIGYLVNKNYAVDDYLSSSDYGLTKGSSSGYSLSGASDTESALSEEKTLSKSAAEPSALTTSNSASLDTSVDEVYSAASDISEKKVIKTGNLSVTVENAGEAVTKITDVIDDEGGFVQSSNVYTASDDSQSATVVVKVPAKDFEKTVKDIKKLVKSVESESVSGQDVTAEYVDLQAQLKNYRAEEEQYIKIMEQATTVEDTLKVADKLARVRGNIEQVEGRIKYLENQTDFSTITIYLSEETKVSIPTKEWKPWENAKVAFQYWVKALQGLVDASVWIILFVGPVVIVALIIVLIIRAVIRKRKKAKIE